MILSIFAKKCFSVLQQTSRQIESEKNKYRCPNSLTYRDLTKILLRTQACIGSQWVGVCSIVLPPASQVSVRRDEMKKCKP